MGTAARVSTVLWLDPLMVAKTVNPPFWLSRLDELSARLKKNWLVALSGCWPSRLSY